MKKAFLSLLVIGSSCALYAQVEQTTKDTVPNATVTPTAPTTQNPANPDDKTTLKSTGQYRDDAFGNRYIDIRFAIYRRILIHMNSFRGGGPLLFHEKFVPGSVRRQGH